MRTAGLSGQRESWWLFQGTGLPLEPAERDRRWPAPPPWRNFGGGPDLPPPPPDDQETERRLGAVASGLFDSSQISVINAALFLRRPLLVTGRPGSGKSSLAYLIARELRLGRVLRWPITSRTAVRSGLYEYDAIGRAQATVQLGNAVAARSNAPDLAAQGPPDSRAADTMTGPPIGDFVHLGPLGTALLPRQQPRVLLIDEMDKSDFDLPNDLLNIFEDGEFFIPELARMRNQTVEIDVYTADPGGRAVIKDGTVRCHAFPVVIITSNGEREFPPAFLRRCTRLDLPDPDLDRLAALVAAHFPTEEPIHSDLVARFAQRREELGGLAADQLLNAAYLATSGARGDERAWNELLDAVWHRLSPEFR
ncbi:AAA family ATPase [Frankia sp. CNm7]|uniref:AAA family ATPase n=1 Tax=Frankia nepalensis TaxID=1836974 RepID=A0A937USY7_9ACTN|nr:AAA family ATPase [Frankia nepalensis]MBL7512257.1 AAA family ATPase [Frankia nepalensis]MBL7520458.1 AAA family ATPase [Frankia nepalensis]MBL7632593.1 AAA family ATPase [Frankia nepalensis]